MDVTFHRAPDRHVCPFRWFMEGLIQEFHPDMVLRNDVGSGRPVVPMQGKLTIARRARIFSAQAPTGYMAPINGTPGAIAIKDAAIFSLAAFTVVDGKIVAIDILSDPERAARIDLSILERLPKIQ